jgi:hypothetical protein
MSHKFSNSFILKPKKKKSFSQKFGQCFSKKKKKQRICGIIFLVFMFSWLKFCKIWNFIFKIFFVHVCRSKPLMAYGLHLIMALLCVKIPIFLPWENQSFTNNFGKAQGEVDG